MKKKATSFLQRLAQLVEAVDKEISDYWRDFFAGREGKGGKR